MKASTIKHQRGLGPMRRLDASGSHYGSNARRQSSCAT